MTDAQRSALDRRLAAVTDAQRELRHRREALDDVCRAIAGPGYRLTEDESGQVQVVPDPNAHLDALKDLQPEEDT